MSTRAARVVSSPIDDDGVHDRAIHEIVHKARPSSCLVQEWHHAGTDRFVLRLREATAIDPFFRPDPHTVDLITLGEVVRQAGLLLPHVGYAVPGDWSFIMKRLAAHVEGSPPPLGTETEVIATCSPHLSPTGTLRSMVIDLELARCGHPFAWGQGHLNVVSPRLYQRIRPASGPVEHVSSFPRVAHTSVGRTDPADVVLGHDTSGHPRIAVDTGHPVHFDHLGDHLPGMVALEAARQAYVLTTGDQPGSFTARFDGYLELHPEAELNVARTGADAVIHLRQHGSTAVRVAMAPPL